MPISRLYDFTPNTLIQSGQVDDELNQLVAEVNLKLPLVGGAISGNLTVGGTLGVTGATTVGVLGAGATTVGALTATGAVDFSTGSINAGSSNKVIDAYTRATGTSVGARGVAISASSGNYTNSTTGTFTNTTNLDATITTNGRPVFLALMDDGSTNGSHINGVGTLTFAFRRDSTLLGYHSYASNTILPPGCCFTIDVVAAGTYVYHFATMPLGGGQTTTVKYCKLVAFEL